MTIPPTLTLRTVLDAVPHPKWWFDLLTTEPLAFASLDRWSGTVAEYLSTMFDPSLTFDDLEWIKAQWPGKLVVKGIQTLDDARAVVDRGVDGIVLSNHGGRQLDRAPVPFHLLPSVARELGKDTEILLDTGIMSGADIVAAIALGARCTLVGRAYLYGLMAGGEAGVTRAIEILDQGVIRTMRLLGVTCLEELSPKHVTQLRRLTRSSKASGPECEAGRALAVRRPPNGCGRVETCQGGYVKFGFVCGRACLNFAGTMKHRNTSPEERLTEPAVLSEWAVAAGLVDAGIAVTDHDLASAIEVREAIYRTATARLDDRQPTAADVELLNKQASQPQLTPRLLPDGTTSREGTAPQLLASLAADLLEPARGARNRQRQTVRPPELLAALRRFLASQEPPLVRDGDLRQQGEGAGLPGPPARCRQLT